MRKEEFLLEMEAIIGPSVFFEHKSMFENAPERFYPLLVLVAIFGASIDTLITLCSASQTVVTVIRTAKFAPGGPPEITIQKPFNKNDSGNEWIAPGWMLKDHVIPNFEAMRRAQLKTKLLKKRFSPRVKNDLPRKRKKAFKKLIQSF